MKLGICYMLFEGEELLEFAIKNIRQQVDWVSVTYQTTSYFGNKCSSSLLSTLEYLKSINLINELIYFEPDLSISPKQNELQLRNLGLDASRKADCSHHISADVDEFYQAEQLEYVKNIMCDDYDYSVLYLNNYYKNPSFLVVPDHNLMTTFIHPVSNRYNKESIFPFQVEITRKLTNSKKYRVFDKKEIVIHHMSYVRKDIRIKLENSSNGSFYNIDKFVKQWEKYELGQRICIAPDFVNRRTIQVENQFGINLLDHA